MSAALSFREIRRSDDGTRVQVGYQGDGPLVLMVHGFPESWISWRHQIPTIADAGYMAAAIQTRGYGDSDKPEAVEAYTLHEMAADIVAVIDGLGFENAVLIGHDWGAAQVYAAAILYPEKVRALVGMAYTAGPFVDRKVSEIWAEQYPDRMFYQSYFQEPGVAEAEFEADPERFLRLFLYALAGDRPEGVNGLIRPPGTEKLLDGLPDPRPFPSWLPESELAYYAQSFAKGGFRGPINRYRAQDLDVEQMRPFADRMIGQPALYIGGERDPARHLVPGFDRYIDPIPRCTDPRGIHILQGIGHWIQQEAPDQVNRILLDFLAEAVPLQARRPDPAN